MLTGPEYAGALNAGQRNAFALVFLNAQSFDWSSASFQGTALLVLNCISYSLYLVLSRPILAHYKVSTFTATVFRYGAILIVLVALPQLFRLNWRAVPADAWWCAAGVVLLCTAIPYLLNSWALARTHASQGEQRSLALALRLAAARAVADRLDTPPLLLLDDVFSELDPDRSAALLTHLPPGQTVITTAAGLPPGATPEAVLRVAEGHITPEA